MKRNIPKIKNLLRRYKLSFAIGGAIMITFVLTILSVALYNVTGSAKLDLSRPGYDAARKQLKKSDVTDNSFKSDGKLDTEVMKGYLKKYEAQTSELSSYGDFSQKLLDDSQLGLTGEQIAPSDGANP